MLRIGIAIEETWDFFNEIYADLARHHQSNLFKRRQTQLPIFNTRLNRYLFHHDLQAFMRSNDVIFFEWASQLLSAATHLPKACGIVTRLHRYEMANWVDRINWEAVDKIILVSRAKEEEFAIRFPEQSSKIVVIGEAVDLNKFHPRPKQFEGNIGILCHLTPRKRVYELILAFYELVQLKPDLHLYIAGDRHIAYRDYYEALNHIVNRLGLKDKVTFNGNVTDPWNWYHQIDIFISSSYSEGLQVAPMEAMACGCYCLAHRWDGAEELLPKEYLFYTNKELQERILSHCDVSESEKQGQRDQMRGIACDKFDINQTKVQIRRVIEEVGASANSINGLHK